VAAVELERRWTIPDLHGQRAHHWPAEQAVFTVADGQSGSRLKRRSVYAGLRPMVYPSGMNAPAKRPESKDARAERLAAALRENLKRRKAQARSQAHAKEQGKDAGKESG
jgi:hypothetical protein